MKKILFKINISLFCILLLTACGSSTENKKVGIIIPMEHKAMTEIVMGFTQELLKTSPVPVKFKIANAQSDINLQRSIIQQMKNEHYDLIVPIATGTSEMTIAAIKEQPIVSLAATYTQEERALRKPCNVAVVHDEITSEPILKLIHDTYPHLTQLTLIHSATDKIFPEVKDTIVLGKKYGITVKPMMTTSLNDLYSLSKAIPNDAQGILVLKDSLIVSGITTLELVANKKQIPLITSDQGSVQDGAAFAIGVHEKDIGIEGAKLAAKILAGENACHLPITEMTKLTVFINPQAIAKENQPLDLILQNAKRNHFEIELVNANKEKTS